MLQKTIFCAESTPANESYENLRKKVYLQPIGELAHLARALAWHARGNRFDSGILHQIISLKSP